jgi:hypothetical protein
MAAPLAVVNLESGIIHGTVHFVTIKKEGVMNVKNVFTMGFISMIIAATGLPAAAEIVVADESRVDVIETVDEKEAQFDSQLESAGAPVQSTGVKRVDFIDSIDGQEEPTYSYTIPMSH